MARFVLLYFRDDEAAEEFTSFSEFKGLRVVGMYRDPHHKPCSCDGRQWKNNRMWAIHKTYGYPVHKACGRISKNWRASYGRRMFGVFGTNLLPLNETPRIFRDWKQELNALAQRAS